jgi:hypothetical protein
VLGDLRVRQAIELAIDKQSLVHTLLADRVTLNGSLLTGHYGVDLPPSEFGLTQPDNCSIRPAGSSVQTAFAPKARSAPTWR